MSENETVILQKKVPAQGHDEYQWTDYSRATEEQVRAFINRQAYPNEWRGVDWITRDVVVDPTQPSPPGSGIEGLLADLRRPMTMAEARSTEPGSEDFDIPVHSVNREPDAVTYRLGHNEQMQISIALGAVHDWLRDGTNRLNDVDMQHVTPDVIEAMLNLFALPGLITITKDAEQ